MLGSIGLGREWGHNKNLHDFGIPNPLPFRVREVKMPETKKEHKWQKVEDNIIRFEKPGDECEGLLVSRESGRNFGNEVYKLSFEGRNLVVFGTAILQTKMSGIPNGKYIRIVYLGDLPNKNAQLNDIKNFDVYIE